MEKLKVLMIGLGIVFLALGGLIAFSGGRSINREESWLVQQVPKAFDTYKMAMGNDGPDVSYKMTEATYKELKPYGIVARVMQNPIESYDTVVIMSSKKESFHDPRVCFTAQGWILTAQEEVRVPTKKHGDIGVTLTTMTNNDKTGFAAFFYRGPDGYTATSNGVKWQMLRYQMKNFKDGEGAFYRVIPLHPTATKEQLIAYIGTFIDALNESSQDLL